MLAYSVTQRAREMGIRMALGARPAAVFQLVVRQGMLLVVVGILLGIGGAFAATRVIATQLFGVGPTDPLVFGVVGMAVTVAGLAACSVPARRATRADPIAALRME
jgi:ABC-type antimicrobial peptide transport system permease subunit